MATLATLASALPRPALKLALRAARAKAILNLTHIRVGSRIAGLGLFGPNRTKASKWAPGALPRVCQFGFVAKAASRADTQEGGERLITAYRFQGCTV